MKTHLHLLTTILYMGGVAAHAQSRFFDSASSALVWDQSTTANWGTVTGGPYTSLWTSYADAYFEGTGGTVSVSASNQPYSNRLNFTADGYVLNGGTINMGNPGGINNFNVTGSSTATINSNISQPYGTGIQKIGTGTLVLGGTVTSTAGNNRVDGGTLRIAGGSFSGNVYIADSGSTTGTIELTGGTLTSSGLSVVGTRGNATLLVNGGTANFNGGLYMGYYAVGGVGNTTLNLNNGTLNVGGSFILGQDNDTGATSVMNVTGGTFNSTGSTTIGNFGSPTSTQTLNVSAGTFNASNTLILAIRGNASINISGTGTLTMPGLQFNHVDATASSGTVNLDGGTLNIGSTGIFRVADTGTFNFNGGTLRATANNGSFIANNLTRANVRNGGAIINDQGYSITIAQALLHSNLGGDAATDGGLSKQGTGDLTLTNASNSYTGGTSVFAGRLVASASGALGTAGVTVSPGAQVLGSSSAVLANNFNVSGDGGTGSTLDTELRGAIRLDGATVSGTVTLTGDASFGSYNNNTATFSGQVTESGGARVLSINKSSANAPGTVVLSNTANNYSGGTVVHNGTLRVSAPDAAGTYGMLGAGPVTVNANATLTFFTGSTANNHTYNNTISLNSATLRFEDGMTILPGAIALTGGNTFHGVWDGKNLQADGVISGTGGIVKTGDASLLMNNANTYSGITTISAGEILVGVNPVGNVGAITSSATGTGTLRLNGGALYSNGATARDVLNPVEILLNSTLGNGANNGALTLKAPVHLGGAINTPRTLTVDSPVDIQGEVTSGSLIGLTKAGGSTLTLSGSGDWNGDTSINAGTLYVAGGAINNSGNIGVASGATLRINTTGQVRGPALNITSGGTVLLEAGTLRTNSITGSGSLVWSGGDVVVYSNAGLGSGGDVSSPNGSGVYRGRELTVTGDLTTGAGTSLDLGDLYIAGSTVFNHLAISGSLTVGAGTTLRSLTTPYLLRGSNGGANFDYGSLVLVEALGGIINPGNFDFIAPGADGRPFSEYTGPWVAAGDPNQLPVDTWYLETTATQVIFHYKVSAAVPEPGTAGIMIAGGLLLRVLSRRRDAPHI
jgi:autotransporter-associated beta strand protein